MGIMQLFSSSSYMFGFRTERLCKLESIVICRRVLFYNYQTDKASRDLLFPDPTHLSLLQQFNTFTLTTTAV